VDPESELFAPLHKINPLRLGWIERIAGDSTAARPRRRLRWRHPFGVNGGAGASVPASTSPRKRLASRSSHKLESGATVDYRLVAAEELAARCPVRSTS